MGKTGRSQTSKAINRTINAVPLTLEVFEREQEVIKQFDCGVSSLNQFIKDKRKCIGHLTERIAKSYLVYDGDTLVGYYCLSAGTIRATDAIRSQYKSWKSYPHYPAVLIGRFAIHVDFAHLGYGSSTMNYIKRQIAFEDLPMAIRYIAVDAINDESTVQFYERNSFTFLSSIDQDDNTRIMYYDVTHLFE